MSERLFGLLKRMKEESRSRTFEETIFHLMEKKDKVPASLFGSLKNKTKSFSSKEREKIWEDKNR